MSLQIIYGTAGIGKTTYLFEEIQEKVKQNTKYPIKMITPEQFSFTAEKQLLETSPKKSMIMAEVITFARMAYRILNEVGGKTRMRLASSGRAMLLDHILLTNKNNFSFLGSSDENVDMIARQLTELKKHRVKVNTLKEVMENTEDKYLKTKLQDVANIYELYANTINNNYIDENDSLTLLADKLEQSEEFKNCDIYIDEFVGFTTQEYEILRKLMKQSHKINITICADNLNENTNPDVDVFYANKKTANRILEIAKQEKVEIEEPICLNANFSKLNKQNRFKSPELAHLAESMSLPFYQKYEEKTETISLFLANNPYAEIEQVAIQITKLVKQGYRYEDIAVITKDISSYASLCKVIFASYDIPVFIDEKKDLSNNPLVRFILALLEIFAKNWSYEAVIGYSKTGFLDLEARDIALLENYCIKYGIKGSKWYKAEWNFYDETEEEKASILYSKEKVVKPLMEFKAKLQGLKTVKEITTALYKFLKENNINEKLQEKIQILNQQGELEKAKEYEISFQTIMNLFDEIVLILGEQNITFDKYAKVFKMGLGQSDLGTIPATLDQVIVGDVDRSRSHKVKVAFLIGLNDGKFPSIHKEEGFLDDSDREVLKENGIELAKGTQEALYDDNFNIYKAFTTAEERLYLSYVSSDNEGKSLRPSILVNKIKRIFPNLQEQSDVVSRKSEILLKQTTFDELLIQLRNFKEGEKIDDIWFQVYYYYQLHEPEKLESSLRALDYQNIPETLKKENLQKLYGNNLKTSVSRLEQYQACPFSYYLKYGLKLKEKNTFQVATVDTGNFMHEVIDSFFEYLEENNISVKQISEEQVKEITEEIVQEKLTLKKYDIFNSIPRYRILAQRLKKVIVKSMWYIVQSIQYSEFEVLGHEVEFKEGKEFEPIIFELQGGKKVEITGKIDRMDIAKTPDGNYIRIIDYKSSVKHINLNEVLAGLQLQLLTYLDATCKRENLLPAGVFYFGLIESIIDGNSQMDEEQIKEELRKKFRMQGLILADSQIVKKMDTTLQTGKSNIVDVQIKKDGEVSEKTNTLNRKQFEKLQLYMDKIIKQISQEILSGKISIEPYYRIQGKKTPCEYCSYKPICQFSQTTKNNYRYIANANKEFIFEQINSYNSQP